MRINPLEQRKKDVQFQMYKMESVDASKDLPRPQYPVSTEGFNGGWQSDKDDQERRKMIAKIRNVSLHLLQQRKPNARHQWLEKLPQITKQLELYLYRTAKSFAGYNDASTLEHRLQQLAVNLQQQQQLLQQQQLQQQSQNMSQQPQQQQSQRRG